MALADLSRKLDHLLVAVHGVRSRQIRLADSLRANNVTLGAVCRQLGVRANPETQSSTTPTPPPVVLDNALRSVQEELCMCLRVCTCVCVCVCERVRAWRLCDGSSG